jgi:hypothetical protein
MAASAIFYLVAEGTRSSHPRTLHEPHWEPGTYVATLTPETTQQHIDDREIRFLCPQFRETHSFDSDIAKLLLDRRLEHGVHFL